MRRLGVGAASAAVMVLVAGCGGGEAESAPSPSASASASVSASPSVAPSPTAEVHIESPQERVDAGAEAEGWKMPDQAYETASDYVDDVCETLDSYEERDDPDAPPSSWLTRANPPEGDEKLALRAGVPVLCPRWEKTVLEVLDGKAEQLLLGGSYEVSSEVGARSVRPGTYRTRGGEEGLSDCYWERSTPDGQIIDNQFVSGDAKAITVTIEASDGSFTTRDCGVWRQVK